MKFFQRASVKRKQVMIIMLTTSLALFVACAAFSIYEVITFRAALVQNLSTMAEIIGNNSVAALDFNDAKAATETLSALQAKPGIVAACIYDKDGHVFAIYDHPNDNREFRPPSAQREGQAFGRRYLTLFRPILHRGESVGTIYLESDMKALYSRLEEYAVIVVGVFAMAILMAFFLSAWLQRLVSEPILDLAQTAQAVARDRDYSVRVTKHSQDEIGVLIDGFNEMLNQIQERDGLLRRTNDELESRVLARTGELANSLSLVHATLEATADGILVTRADGQISNFNENFKKMWRLTDAAADAKDNEQMLGDAVEQLTEPETFLGRIAELGARPEMESMELLEFKDGRVFERFTRPQRVEGGIAGRVWSFRDITERKRAEERLRQAQAELECRIEELKTANAELNQEMAARQQAQEELGETHKRLMTASRQAGMAEVASGVLHNVGNVLNSINVSAHLVTDRFSRSKLPNLGRVAALMAEHKADLGSFITDDPKGKQIPAYLGQLADHLTQEQGVLGKEIEGLRKNIEHIKDIVAVQQNYAKVSGLHETLNLLDLVEDAVRMNAGSLVRHDVKFIREFASDLPQVTVDKHKVLQILVNLIRNAKYACDDSGLSDKRLTMRVANGGETVRIQVIDNGVGIPAENLLRIFNHGFTTRENGHGFGLHSGALAAKELGGSLIAQSEGPGKGATFTLEFPCQPKRRDK